MCQVSNKQNTAHMLVYKTMKTCTTQTKRLEYDIALKALVITHDGNKRRGEEE